MDGFFLLSGFLIVQSWTHDPEFLNFLRKRMLRIVPGYVVAAVLSLVAVGLLAPGTDHFFHKVGMPFVKSLLVFAVPGTPLVLPGMPYPVVNGSFWTLAYEVRCYLIVGVLGVIGLFRRPALWLIATVLLVLGAAIPGIIELWRWPFRNNTFVGNVDTDFHLTASFFVGGCFYLFRSRIYFKPWRAAVAVAIILGCRFAGPVHIEMALVVFGSYLMFYLAQLKTQTFSQIKGLPDISYGIYLYGFPVESLWIFAFHGSPWVTALVSILISAVLGWVSWHVVERPCLKLKHRSTATLRKKSGFRIVGRDGEVGEPQCACFAVGETQYLASFLHEHSAVGQPGYIGYIKDVANKSVSGGLRWRRTLTTDSRAAL